MKKGYTEILVVLDRSGSMASIADDTIGGYNTFIAEQKKLTGDEVKVTLVQFDNLYEVVYSGISLFEVPELTDKTFVPRGNTALYDAVGRTINDAGARFAKLKEEERPESVLFVILTDGHENASREFTSDQVKKMTEHQTQKYSWQFLFLGANQDAIHAGNSIGVSGANSMTYAATSIGTSKAFASAGAKFNDFRSILRTTGDQNAAVGSLSFSSDEREEQENEIAKNVQSVKY